MGEKCPPKNHKQKRICTYIYTHPGGLSTNVNQRLWQRVPTKGCPSKSDHLSSEDDKVQQGAQHKAPGHKVATTKAARQRG